MLRPANIRRESCRTDLRQKHLHMAAACLLTPKRAVLPTSSWLAPEKSDQLGLVHADQALRLKIVENRRGCVGGVDCITHKQASARLCLTTSDPVLAARLRIRETSFESNGATVMVDGCCSSGRGS